MPFYEYEYIVQNLIDILKEKQEAEEKQSKNHQEDYNTSKMMRNAKNQMPNLKTPTLPKIGGVANFPGIPSSLKI